jgi:hypothetical protein
MTRTTIQSRTLYCASFVAVLPNVDRVSGVSTCRTSGSVILIGMEKWHPCKLSLGRFITMFCGTGGGVTEFGSIVLG